MELDDKTIMELAEQLGLSADKRATVAKAKSLEKKSDDEIVAEILKLKEKLKENNISYEKQLAAVKSLMPMMNDEQKTRLSKIIGLIESK